ncbi:PREDICTED: uncharacterized protein LOC108568671 [Nicrophorus vespilloides]|uniref:Uncharacterized protein LOC108568671 n=1 Tax=Nicrophorus vespilloides TaxID=110193 RepID=A0ABM1NEW6_NICVS|nr:PREDICTED: uncharacterized protein LOC108568671 [Nicrophorus vespilloides]
MEIPATLLMTSGTYVYVAVKGSVHSSTSQAYGLDKDEETALAKKYTNLCEPVVNGVLVKASPVELINALGELGYKVVTQSGESEIVWTMQREV